MATSAEILKKIHKDHGANIATMGEADYEQIERNPTGIFPLDLAMGGGWPRGRCSMIYGPESSNKTNIVLSSIAQAQIAFPDTKQVFADAEFALDKPWARKMGVDLNRLIILQPESAEQCVDFIESFAYAEDVSLIALDSIAALITRNEIESSAEKASVGGASLLIGKMYRKLTAAQRMMANAGKQPPTFLAINQTRTKIGVMFGNPETTPGGMPPKFASSMIARTYGKNVMDTKVSKAMPLYKEVNCVLQKWKCPILSVNAVFQMQMIEARGEKPGYVNDWNTIAAYMKELDYLTKGEKGGWIMSGEYYQTLDECKTALYSDPAFLQGMKLSIIEELFTLGKGVGGPGDETPAEESEE